MLRCAVVYFFLARISFFKTGIIYHFLRNLKKLMFFYINGVIFQHCPIKFFYYSAVKKQAIVHELPEKLSRDLFLELSFVSSFTTTGCGHPAMSTSTLSGYLSNKQSVVVLGQRDDRKKELSMHYLAMLQDKQANHMASEREHVYYKHKQYCAHKFKRDCGKQVRKKRAGRREWVGASVWRYKYEIVKG